MTTGYSFHHHKDARLVGWMPINKCDITLPEYTAKTEVIVIDTEETVLFRIQHPFKVKNQQI